MKFLNKEYFSITKLYSTNACAFDIGRHDDAVANKVDLVLKILIGLYSIGRDPPSSFCASMLSIMSAKRRQGNCGYEQSLHSC